MTTIAKKIDWLFPEADTIVTYQDFKDMVISAERSGDMSFEQFKNSMQKWLKK
jgi:ribosomal protein S11